MFFFVATFGCGVYNQLMMGNGKADHKEWCPFHVVQLFTGYGEGSIIFCHSVYETFTISFDFFKPVKSTCRPTENQDS